MGVAATVLYISCIKTGESISQKDISNAAGITDVTLRNRFKDLRNQLTKLGYDFKILYFTNLLNDKASVIE